MPIFILRLLAWANLIICSFGSLYIFREFGIRLIPEQGLLEYTEKIVNPFGISVSIALFLQGIFGCVLLLVIASIADNVLAIRRQILQESRNMDRL